MSGTILDRILEKKKDEVRKLKEQFDAGNESKFQKIPFYDSFIHADKMNIIAEVKRASPSKGNINLDVNPAKQAKHYEASGANAISVLTDEPFFKGTLADLKAVRDVVGLPILCKDFIIDPIQIDAAKQAGANVILLIAAALDDEKLKSLYEYAYKQDLEVLLEVHNEEEMERALVLNPSVIGVNNRNLKTFEVDLGVTERLLSRFGKNHDRIFISESGIKTAKDAERVQKAGAKAILVGETLMLADDIQLTMNQLKVHLR
ncbi:indole-3-glycerol phosphate synthase TrpC [Bacillus smithii]|uniref:indole-3-glycerol phosphate synthase TrpC n=1 Tax=Bacillus smithii TaxID=1479 RepID=UPI002E1A5E5C|nr:indole-3-glycerol phosphate synthase TrpC [Bacillus smithii]MED1490219.1 indole-3-glycerol phosphate synthase TrpC [Bacillus smithii]